MCRATSGCVALSYAATSVRSKCWLKQTAGPCEFDGGYTSWVAPGVVVTCPSAPPPPPTWKYLPNTVLNGGVVLATLSGQTPDSCRAQCEVTVGCTSVSVNVKDGRCFLQKSATTCTPSQDYVSLINQAVTLACTSAPFPPPPARQWVAIPKAALTGAKGIGEALVGLTAEQCQRKCEATIGCVAFHVSRGGGGKCWLKQSIGGSAACQFDPYSVTYITSGMALQCPSS
jgi:hypothetical protein